MNIEILTPAVTLDEADVAALALLAGPEGGDELRELIARFGTAARPKAIYGVFPVGERDADGVTIGGVRIDSPLMSQNLGGVGRAFPYITTCGDELAALASELSDPLAFYWVDEIMKRYLRKMQAFLNEHIKRRFDIKNKLAAMNPGSIKEWPLTGQKQLFDIFGGSDKVRSAIGVTLKPSMLMLPTKSVSGIAFATDTSYENCSRCPILTCPGRRAEFDPTLY